jgi:hypothetical protein
MNSNFAILALDQEVGSSAGGEARIVVRPPDLMTRTVLVPPGPAEEVADAEARVGDPKTQSGPAVVLGSAGGGGGGHGNCGRGGPKKAPVGCATITSATTTGRATITSASESGSATITSASGYDSSATNTSASVTGSATTTSASQLDSATITSAFLRNAPIMAASSAIISSVIWMVRRWGVVA